MIKIRKHHNNKGYRQIKNGVPAKQMKQLAKKLGIPYGENAMETAKLIYQTKLETARKFISMMKEDEGFSTFWPLEEIAERVGIKYEDIEDLESYEPDIYTEHVFKKEKE